MTPDFILDAGWSAPETGLNVTQLLLFRYYMITTSLMNTLNPTPVTRHCHNGDLEAIMRLGPLHLPAKCTPLVHHCSTQYLWFLLLRLNTLIFPETILLFISLSCQIYQQSAQLHDHVWWELSGGCHRCQISSWGRLMDRGPGSIDARTY